ncbi:hypothetical protein [Streptomyces nodosus]|uniref:hypothetical protein n=1 Tax=Streptomyces nodosus TaxID=40318 RepID=UPI00380BCAE9
MPARFTGTSIWITSSPAPTRGSTRPHAPSAPAPAGDKGAILRRERLYRSHVVEWRQARDAGVLEKLADHRTSPARPKRHPAEVENDKLRRQVERLEKEVAKRDAALEVLGKTHALLEALSKSAG